MLSTDVSTHGCGRGACACASEGTAQQAQAVARVNGVALHAPDQWPDADTLRERAWAELLRQRAVALGVWRDESTQAPTLAPVLNEAQRQRIEDMLLQEVPYRDPDEAECLRYFTAHKNHFVTGQALHLRHILFAVTPGVDVHALRVRAENALLELSRKHAAPKHFESLAAQLSNCPSGAQGGDLGWITPDDCAPELANELFDQTDVRCGMGIHPRLVHTRFGFHIIDVQARRKGKIPSFADVRESVRAQLRVQARAVALRHYMQQLMAQAQIEGVALEGAGESASPLIQ